MRSGLESEPLSASCARFPDPVAMWHTRMGWPRPLVVASDASADWRRATWSGCTRLCTNFGYVVGGLNGAA